WHFEEKQDDREDRGRQNVAVGLDDGVLHEAVTDEASVDEDVDGVAIELLDLGLRNKTMQAKFAWIFRLRILLFDTAPGRRLRQSDALERLQGCDRYELIENVFAENLVNAVTVAGDRARDEHGVGRGVQFEMLIGMREGVVRN